MDEEQSSPFLIGLISDTHGLLRPGVFEVFRDVDHILHAGDVGQESILADLGAVAPVTAVWGNVDGWGVRSVAREVAQGELGGLRYALLHGHQVEGDAYASLADRFPAADLIVHGHSHRPSVLRVGRALVVDPGSAGPRRFGKPVSVALVEMSGSRPRVRHVDVRTGEVVEL